MREEGWYADPYGLHERRWFSDGVATKLVSDGGTTSDDPPPNTPLVRPPEPVTDSGPTIDAGSMHRDAAAKGAREADAGDAFVETGGD